MHELKVDIKLLTDCTPHIPYLAELWYEQISKHWVPNASVDRAKENLMKHLNAHDLPLTLVALNEGEPIGMASLRHNDGIRPDLHPWLGSLIVSPRYQKCKVGEQLIDAIKKNAKDKGYDHLYLLAFDRTIPKWYEKLGWRVISTDQLFGHTVAVMKISL